METSNKQKTRTQDEVRNINKDLLKEVKLDKAASSLKSLFFLTISTLVFFITAASYSLYFTIIHWKTWYFAFSGIVIASTSILYIIVSIMQLKQLLSIDYNTPILNLQEDIAQIKTSIVNNLRIAVWVLPFAPFIGLFLVKVLFNFDLTVLVNFSMVTSFGIITILLEVITLLILQALNSKNINKGWANWLLKGSGSQVDEAHGFLYQIREFEVKEEGINKKST